MLHWLDQVEKEVFGARLTGIGPPLWAIVSLIRARPFKMPSKQKPP